MIRTKKPTKTVHVRIKETAYKFAQKFAKKQGISTGLLIETALYKFAASYYNSPNTNNQ